MKKFKQLIAVLIFVVLTCLPFSSRIYSENYETEEEIDTTLKKIKTIDKSDSRIKVTKLETQVTNLENKETEKKLPNNQRIFYSDNRKYEGIATYKSENMTTIFDFFDDDNNLIWKREGFYPEDYFISDNGNVVGALGEYGYGHKLFFLGEKGEVLNEYSNSCLWMGRVFFWTEDSKYFVCTTVDEVLCFFPNGKVKFNYKIDSAEIWSIYVAEDKIFVQPRFKELYILNFEGKLLKKVLLPRGVIQQVIKSRDNYIVLLPSYCILMDKEFKIFSKFSSTEEYPYFIELVISPKGNLVIIKFKEIGTKYLEGFIVLDKEGKLLTRKEIVSNKLEVNFINESSFTLKTDKFKYLVEVDI